MTIKLYDKLWDTNASLAMAALVQKGDITNPWEVARVAYELADCMAEVRAGRILPPTTGDLT